MPLISPAAVSNIAEETTLRSGRVRPPLFQKKTAAPTTALVDKTTPLLVPSVAKDVSRPSQSIEDSNLDEILKIIKRSDYKIMDQLLQTDRKSVV